MSSKRERRLTRATTQILKQEIQHTKPLVTNMRNGNEKIVRLLEGGAVKTFRYYKTGGELFREEITAV